VNDHGSAGGRVLVVSNSLDFSTDYVVLTLLERGIGYVRLNLDELREWPVCLDPSGPSLTVSREAMEPVTIHDISGVFFRAPTYLRESSGSRYSPHEQLSRHQWAAFARALMVFEDVRWVNHPADTYLAEVKPYQLAVASSVGFRIPPTAVTNSKALALRALGSSTSKAAVKALDSFLVRIDDDDAFFYTQQVDIQCMGEAAFKEMPVIVQDWLDQKTDYRVTVVGERCFAVAIEIDGAGVQGDWRLLKEAVRFRAAELPARTKESCILLARRMRLRYAAVDLARVGDHFFFLEVNPTGEWGWLVEQAGLPIHEAIVDELTATKA
jgi:glutathione synthase/RimK-type ligase-like ATP-grasp enzyme